jgi:hypothetical protein
VVDPDVLVQQILQFLVLIVELSCFIDELLPGLEEVMVLREGLIQNLPYSKSSVGESLRHLFPILLALAGDQILLLAL